MPMFLQRFALVAVFVVVVLLSRRIVPSSMGFAGRIFLITALTAAVLWGTSAAIRFTNGRRKS